jgi:hypothetical protein
MPNDETLSLQTLINATAHMYTALIEYFKFVPEFSNLSYYFKKSLIKTNLNQLFRLNNGLVIKSTDYVDNLNTVVFVHLFPSDLFVHLSKCVAGLLPFSYDPLLLKLFMIVLIFSAHLSLRYENNLIENDSTVNLLNVQNIYVELLWRYILYRCSNYREAVKLFSSFITYLVYSQDINVKLNEFIAKNSSNQTDQLAPILKLMWLDDQKK